MNTNFHTESRMRENCTYGSMRGRAYPITRGAPLYSTPSESSVRILSVCKNQFGRHIVHMRRRMGMSYGNI